jgi:glycosyltransferase involved in cell wall biosynthesis
VASSLSALTSNVSPCSGALVANPGAVPLFAHAAAGLASVDELRAYVLPIGGSGQRNAPAWLTPFTDRWLASEVQRRAAPSPILPTQMVFAATSWELIFVGLQRVGAPARIARAFMYWRNLRFDRALSGLIHRGDRAVIANAGSARQTLQRARDLGVPGILIYPTAHHRFMIDLLQEEGRLQPAFAETLQGHAYPAWHLRRMDSEIDLAHTVVVLSEFQKETFVRAGVDEAKMQVAHLGVDLEAFRPVARPEQKSRQFNVIFVGQITQRKGLSYLLDAFERLEVPNAELTLVGRPIGPTRSWQHVAGVRHIPHVPRSRLPELYAQADVFVLPSLAEGFPQTALEAMACGLPVVVSRHTFAEDVVRDNENGFVIPIRDADALADRLRLLARDPAGRLRMGREARRTAEQFSWRRFGERMAEITTARSNTAGGELPGV